MGFFSRLFKSKQNKNEFQENHDLPDLPNLLNIPNVNKKVIFQVQKIRDCF